MIDWLFVAGGVALLVFAGDALVKGAVNLSLRLGIPALVVSLTVVAFGTSAPELLVSVAAVISGSPGLALGNVVGSNIANVLLILGLPAIFRTIHSGALDVRESYWQMLGATVLVIALAAIGLGLGRIDGLILLAALAAILWITVRGAMTQRSAAREARPIGSDEQPEGADPSISRLKIALYILAGLIGLPIGAELLVNGATNIALRWGVSEQVIGLTLVAVGTSLPELATSVAAAIRRQADVILGNVIGSNFFNLLCILGVASVLGDIPVPVSAFYADLPVMLVSTLLLLPIIRGRDITRVWGLAFVALYVAFIVGVLVLL
ncbi:calcium/sodium antiporter [Pseudoroseicyclus tamaricis]|uniref:Calcium/sodium antiporter n=1 Tax=Pseudoroseicyclus tamaricis TaxID=2705421 RepID=A0A6B2K045_9RHOB|nr:calcium/sodium antiporter [Pseudoroseicyclus tamaricis]NDV02309.1 calcium/sodium antiporter [Pseudoroseicyclus tamaricis]